MTAMLTEDELRRRRQAQIDAGKAALALPTPVVGPGTRQLQIDNANAALAIPNPATPAPIAKAKASYNPRLALDANGVPLAPSWGNTQTANPDYLKRLEKEAISKQNPEYWKNNGDNSGQQSVRMGTDLAERPDVMVYKDKTIRELASDVSAGAIGKGATVAQGNQFGDEAARKGAEVLAGPAAMPYVKPADPLGQPYRESLQDGTITGAGVATMPDGTVQVVTNAPGAPVDPTLPTPEQQAQWRQSLDQQRLEQGGFRPPASGMDLAPAAVEPADPTSQSKYDEWKTPFEQQMKPFVLSRDNAKVNEISKRALGQLRVYDILDEQSAKTLGPTIEAYQKIGLTPGSRVTPAQALKAIHDLMSPVVGKGVPVGSKQAIEERKIARQQAETFRREDLVAKGKADKEAADKAETQRKEELKAKGDEAKALAEKQEKARTEALVNHEKRLDRAMKWAEDEVKDWEEKLSDNRAKNAKNEAEWSKIPKDSDEFNNALARRQTAAAERARLDAEFQTITASLKTAKDTRKTARDDFRAFDKTQAPPKPDPTSQPGTAAPGSSAGNTGGATSQPAQKKLDVATATAYLKQAGGDRAKAQALAAKDGYSE